MITFIIILHIIVCILLLIIVLIQAGRGGGFVEALSGVESMFGTKTNAFLTRATAVLSTLFFITCLSLAILSARQGKSLMSKPATNNTLTTDKQVLPAEKEMPAESTANPSLPIEETKK